MIFISHSSRNNDAALQVRDWLISQGYGEIFLDIDPVQGILPGQRWKDELKRAGERCKAVVVLVSPAWAASQWCLAEFMLADQLGKLIFPILVAQTDLGTLPVELVEQFQFADISAPQGASDGFERLALALRQSGLDPSHFLWPPLDDPERPAYRGLQAVEEADAAVFFGRDGAITRGLDTLRRLRDGAPERLVAILGSSGAGKSSFLRAGLLARLQRDTERFLCLPVVRPERAALTGPRGLRRALLEALKNGESGQLDAALAGEPAGLAMLIAELASETAQHGTKAPLVILPIDQAEEVFAADQTEGAIFLDLLAGLLQPETGIVALLTIRSDQFDRLQAEPRLAAVVRLPFDLSPLPIGAYSEVIEGPARLMQPPLKVDPALTDLLLEELGGKDPLPLLAFSLSRLVELRSADGVLDVADYTETVGGLAGAIEGSVETAFAAALADPALPNTRGPLEALARATFLPFLVQADPNGTDAKRAVARLDELPESAQPLIRHFVDQRLLVADLQSGVSTIEVAHEAMLRHWPALENWIAEEKDRLRALDATSRAATDWNEGGEEPLWLLHRGTRLVEAEAMARDPGYAGRLGNIGRAYLLACRRSEDALLAAERDALESEKRGIARIKRFQRLAGVATALVALVTAVAAWSGINISSAQSERESATLSLMAKERSDNSDYESAARFALAGVVGSQTPGLGFRDQGALSQLRRAAAASRLQLVLKGHEGIVNEAAFSPDGSHVVTASTDGTARIWNLAGGGEPILLKGHQTQITSAAFSPDGTRVVTASGSLESTDKTARVWDTSNGLQVAVLIGHTATVNSALFSADGRRIVTSSEDRTARIWDSESGHEVLVLVGHGEPKNYGSGYSSAAFSQDGTRVATSSGDGTVRVWNAESGRELFVAERADFPVKDAVFSPDGTRIVSIGPNYAVVWDASSGGMIAKLQGHKGVVSAATFSPDGSRIVTASWDHTGRVWASETGELVAELKGHTAGLNSATFSPNGKLVVTASGDATARIWDSESGQELAVLVGHSQGVSSAKFSPDGARIATASQDQTARIWDAAGQEAIASLDPGDGFVTGATFSPDNTRIVTVVRGSSVARIWDATSGQALVVLGSGHTDAIFSAAFSPDGALIVTASRDKSALVWDAETGEQIAALKGHGSSVNSAAFSPDGTQIVTASSDNTVRIWDAQTSRAIATLEGHQDRVNIALFSPDSARIVTASSDKTARVWDAQTSREIQVFSGHDFPVWSAVFSPDGQMVATVSAIEEGGTNDIAQVWRVETGLKLSTAAIDPAEVQTAAFSPDSNRIVSVTANKTAKVWERETGQAIAELKGHADVLESAVYSRDGKQIVTASSDGTARIWDAETGLELARIKGRYGVALASYSPDGTRIVTASYKDANVWAVPKALSEDRATLLGRICAVTLQGDLSRIDNAELAAAPFLDPVLDSDGCRSPSLFVRAAYALGIESWTTGYYDSDPRAAEPL